ncbi:MAG: MFS transporter, partial [Acidimicrobiales bacterium]
IVAITAAQAAMVSVMTVTPVHVREHGHGLGVVGLVMSAHFVGMFGLAPVAGRLLARTRPAPMLGGGAAVLCAGAVGAGLAPGEHSPLTALFLFLLGLGWSATFVAASSLVAAGGSAATAVRRQGLVDTVAWSASGLASAGAGVMVNATSYSSVGLAGAAVALCGPVLALALHQRRGRLA